jgi:hypothetical protein
MTSRLFILASLWLLCGCTLTTYTDPSGAKFSRWSLLNSQAVGKVEMRAGDKLLTLEGYQSNQTEMAAAVVASAVKAAARP